MVGSLRIDVCGGSEGVSVSTIVSFMKERGRKRGRNRTCKFGDLIIVRHKSATNL